MKLIDILEEIKKPNKEDIARHKKMRPTGGKLHYVVKSSEGKSLGDIDDAYVKKSGAKSPKHAAHMRLGQVEYFKKNK